MAREAYDRLRRLGLSHEQVMKRMSRADRKATREADIAQARGDFETGGTFKAGVIGEPTTLAPKKDRQPDRRPRAEQADFLKADALMSGTGRRPPARPDIDMKRPDRQPDRRPPVPGRGPKPVFAPPAPEVEKDPWWWKLTPQKEQEDELFVDWARSQPGGDIGGGLQNIIGQGSEALRNLILGKDKTGAVGRPAGLAAPTQPPRQKVVERGDTYRSIAEKLGVHELELIRANNGEELSPGIAINVPDIPFLGRAVDEFGRLAQFGTGIENVLGGIGTAAKGVVGSQEFADFMSRPGPAEQADFLKAEAELSEQDRMQRVADLKPHKEEDVSFIRQTLNVTAGVAADIIRAMQEGISVAEDIIWKDGANKKDPVEGVDYVVRTTPIEDMPGGQGSGRLAWAESRLPEGTKLDDYNAQQLLDSKTFTESEIWWMIGQGLLQPQQAGVAPPVSVGAGGVKRVARRARGGGGGGGGITGAGSTSYGTGAPPRNMRQGAVMGLTSWSGI